MRGHPALMLALAAAAAIAAPVAAARERLPRAQHAGASITIAVRARALQPGELVALVITLPEPATAVRVRAFGRDAAPYRTRAVSWTALVGIDLDTAAGAHDVLVEADLPTGAAKAAQTLDVTSRVFPTRTLTVDEAFVTPPEAARARIDADARLLEEIWTQSAPTRLWSGPFVRPVRHPSNSAFGTRSVFNGQPRSPHSGADFLSPAGTPILAPNAGRVVVARDLYYSGGTVIIDHGLGCFSTLAHLSQRDVIEGATVKSGQIVGRVGATGRVTGPHLHWAVRVGGARVDPLSVIAIADGGTEPLRARH